MSCVTCGFTYFVRRKSAGLVCGICRPANSTDYLKLLKLHKVKVKLLEESMECGTRLKHKCLECKDVFHYSISVMAKRILKGFHPCPKCDRARQLKGTSDTLKKRYAAGEIPPTKIRKVSFEEYQKILKKRKLLCLEKEFPLKESTKGSMWHKCLVCEHTFKNYSYNILNKNNGCRKCSGYLKKTTETYKKELYAKKDNKYEIIGEYVNSRKPMIHRCFTCKGERIVTPDNMLRKFYFKCPNCSPAVGGYKTYSYTLGERQVTLQGYEKHALDFLLKKFSCEDIKVSKCGEVPKIMYRLNGKRTHRPDIYIESINTIVEVKSLYTLGISMTGSKGGRTRWEIQRAKYKAARKQGYKYALLVFGDTGRRIHIPKNWSDLRLREARNQILQLNRR